MLALVGYLIQIRSDQLEDITKRLDRMETRHQYLSQEINQMHGRIARLEARVNP